ncbi:defective in methylation-7 protein [Ceratocystis lukuohia]|uniref:Defective in methylation-7 protein n=1 Tax=Ceratocystis lukuohia TaxID=2019550 RepID=A0ABR4MK98_9PEZI
MPPAKRHGATPKPSVVPSVEAAPSPRFTPECQVFRPANAKVSDAEWPVFDLREAVVMDRTRCFVRNLLRVQETGPFIVQGRVYCDTSDGAQVAQQIEIEASSMSIGLDSFGDGDNENEPMSGPVIWAKSYYGFFRIASPALCYRAMFNHTLEAITLYYSIMAVYEAREPKVEQKGKKAKARTPEMALEDVFLEYAVMAGDGCVIEDVKERCMRHAAFLASHFKFETGFSWEGKAFTKYIKSFVPTSRAWEKKNLDVTSVNDDGLDDPVLKSQAYVPGLDTDSSRSISPIATPTELHSSNKLSSTPNPKTPTRSMRSSNSATTTKEENSGWEMEIISRTRQARATTSTVSTPEPGQIAPMSCNHQTQASENVIARKIYEELPYLIGDRNISRFSLKSLNNIVFTNYSTRTWPGAREIVAYAIKDLLRLMESDTEQRDRWMESKLWTDLQEAPEFEGPLTENHSVDAMMKQLRRRSGVQKGQKRPYDEERSLTSGKTSSLRPHKRSISNAGRDESTLGTWEKKSADVDLKMTDEEEYDEFAMFRRNEDQEEESTDESETDSDEDEGTPPTNNLHLVIRSDPMPTTAPNGPGSMWICHVKDCQFVEADADDDRGQERIKMHIHDHDDEATRIDLALAESHGHAIHHLLEKLKNVHNSSPEDSDSEAKPNPKPATPIKRRFFGYV